MSEGRERCQLYLPSTPTVCQDCVWVYMFCVMFPVQMIPVHRSVYPVLSLTLRKGTTIHSWPFIPTHPLFLSLSPSLLPKDTLLRWITLISEHYFTQDRPHSFCVLRNRLWKKPQLQSFVFFFFTVYYFSLIHWSLLSCIWEYWRQGSDTPWMWVL